MEPPYRKKSAGAPRLAYVQETSQLGDGAASI
jgi:hypothetical protein